MKKELVTFKTAKLAKEKGFNTSCWYYYGTYPNESDTLNESGVKLDVNTSSWAISAPEQWMLHKWLREKHGRHVICIPTVTASWTFKILRIIEEVDDDVIIGNKYVSDLPPYKEVHGYDYSTYEQALEEGMIEHLKQIETEKV